MKKRIIVVVSLLICLLVGVICYFYKELYQIAISGSKRIYDNKDWLFSGIGLVVLGWIAAKIANIKKVFKFLKKNKNLSESKKSTSVTFLFGNGFDISVGMNSSYIDFLTWYENQLTQSSSEIQKDFCPIISQFKGKIKNQSRWNTWADFEEDLISIASSADEIERIKVKRFYEHTCEKLPEYLTEQEKMIQIDNILPEDKVEKFKQAFCNFYTETIEAKEIEEKHLLSSRDVQYRYVNFSFTSILDKLLNKIFQKVDVLHVHGTINSSITIGVDDVSLIKTCFKRAELYYLINTKSENRQLQKWYQKATDMIIQSDVVCIYGMSISQTDNEWWKLLVEWLKNDTNDLVIFWKAYEPKSLIEETEIQENIFERLICYSDLNIAEKNALKKRVHIVICPKSFMQF